MRIEEIWANRLIGKTRTWSEVPEKRKNNIKQILKARVMNKEITEEEYEEFCGEKY